MVLFQSFQNKHELKKITNMMSPLCETMAMY